MIARVYIGTKVSSEWLPSGCDCPHTSHCMHVSANINPFFVYLFIPLLCIVYQRVAITTGVSVTDNAYLSNKREASSPDLIIGNVLPRSNKKIHISLTKCINLAQYKRSVTFRTAHTHAPSISSSL
jgi:hypothetical protein